ncbi:hypothetical protein L6164_032014 [Bauhinia variegata]|uniref:Uncharacterized protein n=1 Tax=Bauhinia variegata TaxID=167791 RepID=A0ACB9KMF7_BAUVA|nr:hypothetical protein L6164_032014 [Bauhinia variegata]
MAPLSNQRGSRTERTQDGLQVSNSSISVSKKKWSNLMPLFVALVVIAEIGFLGRLDMAKNVAMVDSWADVFYRRREVAAVGDLEISIFGANQNSETGSCEDWLEREDAVTYSRDFSKEPILVVGAEQV